MWKWWHDLWKHVFNGNPVVDNYSFKLHEIARITVSSNADPRMLKLVTNGLRQVS